MAKATAGSAARVRDVGAIPTARISTICDIYSLASSRDLGDAVDRLSARLSQLQAMLIVIHGEGFDSFQCYSAAIRDNYLWACADIADECGDLFSIVQRGGAA